MSEILRGLADRLAAIEQGQPEQPHGQAEVEIETDNDQSLDPNPVMVPPLQQKLELLKKAVGDEEQEEQPDELNDIKKLSGIQAVIQHEAGEDNDFIG